MSRSRVAGVAIAAVLAGGLALLVLAGAAAGGQVELRDRTIAIVGTADQERLLLRQRGAVLRIDERNPNRSLTAGAGCTAIAIGGGRSRVECPLAGVERVTVSTRGGNDRVGVGAGLPGTAGRDRNFCRASALDPGLEVRTGAGRDVAELSNGADRARGGPGPDVIMGCRGNDALSGGGGGDELSGDRGSDALGGGGGRDWLVGCEFDPDDKNFPRDERGSDELRGGGGSDFLYGCKGRDDYRAGSGSDSLNTRDRTAEPVRCSTGRDLVYGDSSDRLFSCERTTECTTDNFPFLPCNRRLSLSGIRGLRPL